MNSSVVLNNFLLRDVAIIGENECAFCAAFQPSVEAGEPICMVLFWSDGVWSQGPIIKFDAISLCQYEQGLVVIGRNGNAVKTDQNAVRALDLIGDSDYSGPFRQVINIKGTVVVLGEDRGVFRLQGNGWIKLKDGLSDQEFSDARDSEEAYELIAKTTEIWFGLSGYSKDNLCAVGSSGEIWEWNGKIWRKSASPTNVTLKGITPQVSGKYLICGNRGTVLLGSHDNWEIVCSDEPRLNLASIAIFKGSSFLADGDNVFRIVGDRLELADFGTSLPVPATRIVSTDDACVAFAAKEAFITHDGLHWVSIL